MSVSIDQYHSSLDMSVANLDLGYDAILGKPWHYDNSPVIKPWHYDNSLVINWQTNTVSIQDGNNTITLRTQKFNDRSAAQPASTVAAVPETLRRS